MNNLIVNRMVELKSALEVNRTHFHEEGNVIGFMTPEMSVDVTCEVGRYVVTMTNSDGEEAVERYRKAKTIIRECI